MLILPSHLVVAVTILILKIGETMAACYWNGPCLIYCTNMNAEAIFEPIENLYAQRPECHDEFTLRLQPLTYPQSTIGPYWFTANITAVALEVYLRNVVSLSANAFDADAFRSVKKLTFENFEVPVMEKGIFNGLDALEIINIKGATGVSRIDTGVLDSITELREFTFEQTTKSGQLNIDGLTGSSVLSKLEYVKIKYNLENSIKKSTFIGLRNVKKLDLSSSYINFIEDNSFDPISETIEDLNLSSNKLTTVTYGVFSMVLPNIKTIKISGNQWNCTCDLMPFRSFIQQYADIFSGFDCSSPTECKTSNILESDCFETCDIPTTTTPDTTTIPTTTTSPNANFNIQCPSDQATPGNVSIKRSIGYMSIREDEHGDRYLNIDTEQNANSLVIIRLNEKQNASENGNGINCLSRNNISAIPITDLKENIVYSYCLMRRTSTSVSPLDCISYVKRRDHVIEVWLPASSKTLAITLATVFLLLSIVLGLVIELGLVRLCHFYNHNNSKDALGAGRNTIDKPSNIYTRNTIQADVSDAPPLPERPPSLYKHEEPVYAYVRSE